MNKTTLPGFTLICLLMLYACNGGTPDAASIQGIWEHTGYGNIYRIEKNNITLYQYTRATCLKIHPLESNIVSDRFMDIEVDNDGASFTATSPNVPAFRQYFSRLALLPATCRDNTALITDSNTSPSKIFMHLWHTFNDYYAFFREREVNWSAQLNKLYSQLDDGISDEALFARLSKILSAIDDGHVYLISESSEFCPEKIRGSQATLKKGFHNQSQFKKFNHYKADQWKQYRQILFSYLDENSIQQAGGAEGNQLIWGTIDEQRLGYLFIQGMESIAVDPDASTHENVEAVRVIMDQIMLQLDNTQALIIDIRFNGGGHDAVSLAIANRFTDQKRLAMTKTARSYKGETSPRSAYLKPEGDSPYLKPVAVIAGPDSASATEIFLLALRALPQVIQIGEPSSGILSDELYKYLPNGWEISLSNEVYYDHTGVNYEAQGIPPHIQVPVFNRETLETQHDPAVDAAIQALRAINLSRDNRINRDVA